jgi:hypothetical protein
MAPVADSVWVSHDGSHFKLTFLARDCLTEDDCQEEITSITALHP